MDNSILINGQDVPVLNLEKTDELPLVNHKSHHGYVASGEECVDELSFDGITFWCPVEFLRISEGDENIRKTPFTEDETDRYTETIKKTGDIGTLIVCADLTGKTKLRILDGNNRFPIFVNECNPSHVFVKYVEVTSEYEARQIQDTANEHSETTHRTEAFAALANKRDIDAMPKGDRQAHFDYQYARMRCKSKARGKTEFDKLWKRAKYAIPELWIAFEKGQITIESLDAIATLINPETDEILADLQQEILNDAIREGYKTSQVKDKVDTALENWKPEPVDGVEEELFTIAPAKGAGRPVSATAPKATKPPANPKPAPVEKVTTAEVVKRRQEVKATKGKSGRKPSAPSAAKVMTNAPASIPAAIAANPNVHIAGIGREPEKKVVVPVGIYQPLLDVEDLLVEKKLVLSNGSGLTEEAWKGLESLDLKGIDDVLAQVQVLRVFLSKIEESASAVQMDLKDKLKDK